MSHVTQTPPPISRRAHSAIWRGTMSALRIGAAVTFVLLAAIILLRWYQDIRSLEDTSFRVILSLLGVAAGAWLAQFLAAALRKMPRAVLLGAAALVAWQMAHHVLVWSEWKSQSLWWRAWWIGLVGAVMIAHIVWLSLISRATGGKLRLITIASAIASAAMLALLALGPTPLPEDVPPAYAMMMALPMATSLIGSCVLWLRRRRLQVRRPLPRWAKVTWAGVAVAGVFAIGFYAGRVTAPTPSPFEMIPSVLAHLSDEELLRQLEADTQRLQVLTEGLDELIGRSTAMAAEISDRRRREGRDYFLPSEEDRIRAHFMSYLAYRSGLLRLATTYSGFDSVRDPELRARCFLVGYASGASVYRSSVFLVRTYGDEPEARKKLNEADPLCGIAAGSFDRIEEAVSSERNIELFERMGDYYDRRDSPWRALAPEQTAWLSQRIDTSRADVLAHALDDPQTRLTRILRRIKHDTQQPVYAAQSLVSTWIGDMRMVGREPFISQRQIVQLGRELQPGDILLERRNWFASNAFLPGFWPHAALYVGRIEDLERLGLVYKRDGRWTSDDPPIREHLASYLHPAHDGGRHVIIESVSDGVIFNSLEESMHADYVAVLRPRLSDQQKAKAIARAFAHIGKPYDFEFDFFSSDKLVCTELVYRSYEGMLNFELVKIMGRNTLPALELCKKFAAELGTEKQELDFIAFLDAVPQEGTARRATVDDFIASAHRPRGFNE